LVSAPHHPLQAYPRASSGAKFSTPNESKTNLFQDLLALESVPLTVAVTPMDEGMVPLSRFGSLIQIETKVVKPEKGKKEVAPKTTAKQAIEKKEEEATATLMASNLTSMIQVFQTRSDQVWG
jgi:hypothetical protein